MKKAFGIFFLAILFSALTSAQETTYFKDKDFWKKTSEKKANFKKTEQLRGDTLLTQFRRISDNQLLKETKIKDGKAVGIWSWYDLRGNLTSSQNFDVVVYSDEAILGVFDNDKNNPDCSGCQPASFPTGENGMFQFLGTQIRYPHESMDQGTSGTVFIRFMIDKAGNAEPHSILRGVDSYIDYEAWQLIEKMPQWNPATQNGKPINSYWNLPIRFTLK